MPPKLNHPRACHCSRRGVSADSSADTSPGNCWQPAIAFEAVCAALALATGSGASFAPDEAAEAVSFVGADRRSDAGWDVALMGCRYVIHTASPFPATLPKDANAMSRAGRRASCAARGPPSRRCARGADILGRAAHLPSGEVPDWVVRAMAPFSARSRMIVHELNRDLSVSAAKAHGC
jgi:hypothetical protein